MRCGEGYTLRGSWGGTLAWGLSLNALKAGPLRCGQGRSAHCWLRPLLQHDAASTSGERAPALTSALPPSGNAVGGG